VRQALRGALRGAESVTHCVVCSLRTDETGRHAHCVVCQPESRHNKVNEQCVGPVPIAVGLRCGRHSIIIAEVEGGSV